MGAPKAFFILETSAFQVARVSVGWERMYSVEWQTTQFDCAAAKPLSGEGAKKTVSGGRTISMAREAAGEASGLPIATETTARPVATRMDLIFDSTERKRYAARTRSVSTPFRM